MGASPRAVSASADARRAGAGRIDSPMAMRRPTTCLRSSEVTAHTPHLVTRLASAMRHATEACTRFAATYQRLNTAAQASNGRPGHPASRQRAGVPGVVDSTAGERTALTALELIRDDNPRAIELVATQHASPRGATTCVRLELLEEVDGAPTPPEGV